MIVQYRKQIGFIVLMWVLLLMISCEADMTGNYTSDKKLIGHIGGKSEPENGICKFYYINATGAVDGFYDSCNMYKVGDNIIKEKNIDLPEEWSELSKDQMKPDTLLGWVDSNGISHIEFVNQ